MNETDNMYKAWAIAAGIRAIKTMCQTAVAMIPVGVSVTEVGWGAVAGTALLAAICSILTSVVGIPEVQDGASLGKISLPDAPETDPWDEEPEIEDEGE